MCKSLTDFIKTCHLKRYNFDDIKLENKIGEGGNANVYRCKIGCKNYAVKLYHSKVWCRRNGSLKSFFTCLTYEMKVAKRLEHAERSVKTYGYSYKKEDENIKFMIVMELLVSDGALSDYIANEKKWWTSHHKIDGVMNPTPSNDYVYYNRGDDIYWCYVMSTKQKIRIICDFIKAVKELHNVGVVHADIKSENTILHYGVTKQMVKLIDFGISYLKEDCDEIDCKCGTTGYCAPEQNNYELSERSDIYSVAVVAIEVWNGEIWYGGKDFESCRNEVIDGLKKIKKNHSDFGELLEECLSMDAEKRPTAKRLLDRLYQIQF